MYHTQIKVETVAKNGSEKFGATATCFASKTKDMKLGFEIVQSGKTKKLAVDKMLSFLSSNGTDELILLP